MGMVVAGVMVNNWRFTLLGSPWAYPFHEKIPLLYLSAKGIQLYIFCERGFESGKIFSRDMVRG